MHWLQLQGSRRQQCRSMLCLLHGTGNPQAFVSLYVAMKEQPYLHWLAEEIDDFTDESVKKLQQATCSSERTGLNRTELNSVNTLSLVVGGAIA